MVCIASSDIRFQIDCNQEPIAKSATILVSGVYPRAKCGNQTFISFQMIKGLFPELPIRVMHARL